MSGNGPSRVLNFWGVLTGTITPKLALAVSRDMHDAHIVLEAVRLHRLQPVTRRLNEVERMSFIRSGSVFVWEESDDDTGLRRWTDGLLWSASRMREPFLFYETRTVVPRYPQGNTPSLVKQTYSALVSLPSPDPRQPPIVKKWHMTGYLDQASLPDHLTVDTDPLLADIRLPPGMYRSGKSRQRQNNPDGSGGLRWINMDPDSSQTPPLSRTSSPDPSSMSPQSSALRNYSIMPSPPRSPITTSRGTPTQGVIRASVPMAYLDASTSPTPPIPQQQMTLPSFQTAFALSPPPVGIPPQPLVPRSSGNRTAEDARVIGVLNSRSSLGTR
ncbi:hypothetical protein DL93DRAFT_185194 [Clavulina sp. PMI_390]|nr:hypothetical protein DL93DRAFT_185194 [Clavulina sp. PMI_390]